MSIVDVSDVDPFAVPTTDFYRDPYPFYEKLRERGKFAWSSAGEPRWITTSFELATQILNDQRFSVVVPQEQLDLMSDSIHGVRHRDLITGFTNFMLAQDPPQHTRVRKLANKAFTRAEVTEMGRRMEQIIDSLIDKAAITGKMDLISDFALPLPITIICEILGLPAEDHDKFHLWSKDIVLAIEPILQEGAIDRAAEATTALFNYLKNLIETRRKKPGNDLLSLFIQAEEDGDALSLDEVLANMLLLILAGHETTVNLLGNGMFALLEHPQVMKRLIDQPELIPAAIEEVLRYQSPVQTTERYAKESFQYENHNLKKGDRIILVIGAANRDPNQFDAPGTFNIDRQPNKHLAFGQGIHFCLGAPLARFEAKLAFEKLLSRLNSIELDADAVVYKDTASSRALESLPIRFQMA
ncbi:MAG TPA: cytochrome P450 [Oculatellaceae cyanobacterium]